MKNHTSAIIIMKAANESAVLHLVIAKYIAVATHEIFAILHCSF